MRSCLHMVFSCTVLSTLTIVVSEGDTVLLINDGVWLGNDPAFKEWVSAGNVSLCFIDEHARERQLLPAGDPVDFDRMVSLVVEHEVSATWS